MRVVLSRKGFDSQYGRIPSPILPDGTLLSLPIPTSQPGSRFSDLTWDGRTYQELILALGGNPAIASGYCHRDPDLRPFKAKSWQPAFGQADAAESHLARQGIGAGDLFLFFGRFRRTEFGPGGELRYVKGSAIQHIVYGYLEVGGIARGDDVRRYPWHPHAQYARPSTNNTLYLASARLGRTKRPGAGVLDYREDRVLTAPGFSASRWRLLAWMTGESISYHSPKSVTPEYFQSASKGQEFVIQPSRAVAAWARSIVTP